MPSTADEKSRKNLSVLPSKSPVKHFPGKSAAQEMMQDFQNNIIQIATQINQLNQISEVVNYAKSPMIDKTKAYLDRSTEARTRNDMTPLKLPVIKQSHNFSEMKTTTTATNPFQQTFNNSYTNFANQKERKPPIHKHSHNKSSKKTNNLKHLQLQKEVDAKNNPIFCKCKAHLQQVNEINTFIQSISRKLQSNSQLLLGCSADRKSENQSPIRTVLQDKKTILSHSNQTKSYGFLNKHSSSVSSDLQSYSKRLTHGQEPRDQFRELLRERMQFIKKSKEMKVATDRSHLLKEKRESFITQQKKLFGIKPIDEKLFDGESFPLSPKSSVRKGMKIASTPSHDQSDEDKNDFTSPQQKEFMNWQENSMLCNERSIERYMHNYQRIDKIKQFEKISPSKEANPLIQYLKSIDQEKGVPHMLAFKKSSRDETSSEMGYGLRSFYINNKFAKAFGENLKSNQKLNSLILVRNKLNDNSFQQLVMNFPQNLQRLDISNNPNLTIKSYKSIGDILQESKKQKLSFINFEGNQMGDEACRLVCDGIMASGLVKVLNFSKNNLTDIGAQFIADVLNHPESIILSLLLHWNQIRGKGAVVLAKAIKKNVHLQIFDSSFNSFGSSPLKPKPKMKLNLDKNQMKFLSKEKQKDMLDKLNKVPQFENYTISGYKWSKALLVNKRLVHVDLSFNSFKTPDIQLMGESLKTNHAILGIHMMGNEAKVDELGFVSAEKTQDHATCHVFSRIPCKQTILLKPLLLIELLKTPAITNKQLIDLNVSSNCWICEGWSQIEFRVTTKDEHGAFLHLSFEQFKPQRMEQDVNKKNHYSVYRMIPPGCLSYFFTNKDQTQVYNDPTAPQIVNPEEKIQTSENMTINVPKINYIENVELIERTLTIDDLNNLKALPRPEPPIIQEQVRPKSPWTFPKSIFASYKLDTEDHLANCFDYDWRCSKIDKLIRSVKDKDKIYDYLQKNYRAIREAYKFFSALGPSGNVFSIGTNVFSDIIYNCPGLLDSKTLKLSDVDLEFISTNAGNQFRSKNNPDRQIIRFQFLEIFVRLGIDKYFKSKICETYEEAIKKVFEENVLPYFRKFNSNDFRWGKLYNEPCDIVMKKNLNTLKEIYKKYSGREALPSEPKFMSMGEFIDLVTRSGVVDDNFGAREIGTIFNLCMQTQIDEISKDKHYQMQFIEFIEALSRVADRVMIKQGGYQPPGTADGNNIIASQDPISVTNLVNNEADYTTNNEVSKDITNQTTDRIPMGLVQDDYTLDQKISDYIYRIAMTCMGEEYAYQYRKKNERLQEALKKKMLTNISRNQQTMIDKTLPTDKSIEGGPEQSGRMKSMSSSRTTPIGSRLSHFINKQPK